MSFKVYLPKIIGATVVVGFAAGVTYLISNFIDAEPPKQKKVQQVTILAPPPPPPPPKQDTPPPEVQEEVEVPEPEEQMEELPDEVDAPPPGDLGIDAEGGAGGDDFGLIGRKGGRGLLDQFGSPKMVYAANVQRMLEDALVEEEAIRSKDYSVLVQLWIEASGEISKANLVTSTGDEEIDQKIIEAAKNLLLAESPPPDWEQPLRIKLGSEL